MDARSQWGAVRRELVFLVVGLLAGAGVASGAFLALDDDDAPGEGDPVAGSPATQRTQPTIDPTETEFGTLTEEAEAAGIRVRWVSELHEGEETGEGEFVTAHRQGTFVFAHDDTRIVESGDSVVLCQGDGCSPSDAGQAAAAVPGRVRPFYEVLRLYQEAAGSPQYTITGETELASGIFQRCGSYEPEVFGLQLPGTVQRVTQCLDVDNNVPLAVDLVGTERSVGTASLNAIADAEASDFQT